ncbi:MAG: hypothetical protein MUE94_08365 [Verrucomicrobia bacterium]|jgi:hypothetical protein|nr:hypothetical protein [Verrucomicrobiota bacterium]
MKRKKNAVAPDRESKFRGVRTTESNNENDSITPGKKRFYHFTRPLHLPSIVHRGIDRGEVPLTFLHAINYPWLTTNPDRDGIKPILESMGQGSDDLPHLASKTGVRLEIELDEHDPSLVMWQPYAKRLRIRDWFYQRLTEQPQWGSEWHVYRGVIPFDKVTAAYFPATGVTLTPEQVKSQYGAGDQDIEVCQPFVVWVSEAEALSMTQKDFDVGEDRALFEVLMHSQCPPQSIGALRQYAKAVKHMLANAA